MRHTRLTARQTDTIPGWIVVVILGMVAMAMLDSKRR